MLPKNHNIKLDKQKEEHINYCKVFIVFVVLQLEFYLNIHDPGNGFSIGGM